MKPNPWKQVSMTLWSLPMDPLTLTVEISPTVNRDDDDDDDDDDSHGIRVYYAVVFTLGHGLPFSRIFQLTTPLTKMAQKMKPESQAKHLQKKAIKWAIRVLEDQVSNFEALLREPAPEYCPTCGHDGY